MLDRLSDSLKDLQSKSYWKFVLQQIQFLSTFSIHFSRPAEILYGESSMRNGFGLRLLHKFLGLPFLSLQKLTLQSLMERNERDTEVCSFELTEFLVRASIFSI